MRILNNHTKWYHVLSISRPSTNVEDLGDTSRSSWNRKRDSKRFKRDWCQNIKVFLSVLGSWGKEDMDTDHGNTDLGETEQDMCFIILTSLTIFTSLTILVSSFARVSSVKSSLCISSLTRVTSVKSVQKCQWVGQSRPRFYSASWKDLSFGPWFYVLIVVECDQLWRRLMYQIFIRNSLTSNYWVITVMKPNAPSKIPNTQYKKNTSTKTPNTKCKKNIIQNTKYTTTNTKYAIKNTKYTIQIPNTPSQIFRRSSLTSNYGTLR